MVFLRQRAVGRLDFHLAGFFRDAERLVEVLGPRRHAGHLSVFEDDDSRGPYQVALEEISLLEHLLDLILLTFKILCKND